MGAVLVTGANGYVGRHLCAALESAGHHVRRVQRDAAGPAKDSLDVHIGDIDEADAWPASHFDGVDVVVHLAACVHRRFSSDQMYRTNLDGTLALARRAIDAGATQFVFLSTIAAVGPSSSPTPLDESVEPSPTTDYGRSKLQAEQALMKIALESRMAVTVLRPPMVYGRDCPGNFTALARLIRSGMPLPLGSVDNRRSLVGIDNLCDVIVHCIGERRAYNKCFCVADSETVATPQLIGMMAAAMNKTPRLVRFPVGLLTTLAAIVGQRSRMESLCGSLELDLSFVRRELEWSPPVTLADGIARSL